MTVRSSRAARGFTLIELMVVVAIIAIASGVAALALRDPASTRLEREAVRLAALLDSARAEARASGLPVRWMPVSPDNAGPAGDQFRFIGLPPSAQMPTHWLGEGVSAQVVGAPAVRLGPEATIGPQRIVLSLDQQRLVLVTDGLGPFVVADSEGQGS
ncbi:pilus assembly FimT family protein [Ideonella sp. BN130291]|uniref:pilus assembly FimT family protein n=1 Tax=Ideonella sp. BN130291 TaxID=3112940 RepID=UPI002E26F310|nr:prepilin-type N-terminal cleavage/methylation domain-containing protein [Ideonella sp. BN130291]